MPDVGGVADLTHFAIVDDIEPDLGLALHGSVDGTPHRRIKVRRLERLASILREQDVNDLLRTRQAADMCSENAVGISDHDYRPKCLYSSPRAAVDVLRLRTGRSGA